MVTIPKKVPGRNLPSTGTKSMTIPKRTSIPKKMMSIPKKMTKTKKVSSIPSRSAAPTPQSNFMVSQSQAPAYGAPSEPPAYKAPSQPPAYKAPSKISFVKSTTTLGKPVKQEFPLRKPIKQEFPLRKPIKQEFPLRKPIKQEFPTERVKRRQETTLAKEEPPFKKRKIMEIPTIHSPDLTLVEHDPSRLLCYKSLPESLSNHGVKAVFAWQKTFSLRVKGMDRILRYTDNHLDLKRSKIYHHVLKGLLAHFSKTIMICKNQIKLQKLLKKSFDYIHIPELQPIPVHIMSVLNTIPDPYLQRLQQNPNLLKSLPEGIRHQVWERYQEDFLRLVKPYMGQYIEKYKSYPFTMRFDKARSGQERRLAFGGLQEVVSLVNKSQKLYEVITNCLRRAFQKQRNLGFYALRFDLYRTFQENNIPMEDPCAWFIEAIDGAITRGTFTRNEASYLKEFKHCTKKQDVQDILIICHLEFVKYRLPVLIMKQLEQVISERKIPRDVDFFDILFRFYKAGQAPLERLLKNCSFGSMERTILTEFLPLTCILFLPWVKNEPDEMKLHPKITKFLIGRKDKDKACRYFLIMVLLERIHNAQFLRAQQIIDLFLTLDAHLFVGYKLQFNDLITLTTSAANTLTNFPDSLITHIIDFFIRIAKVDNLLGHVLAIQLMAEIPHKCGREQVIKCILHLNPSCIEPEVKRQTVKHYEILVEAYPDIRTLLEDLKILA